MMSAGAQLRSGGTEVLRLLPPSARQQRQAQGRALHGSAPPQLTSNFQPWACANRSYMRKSSQAKRLASAPPAPARTCRQKPGHAP